jgi:hypothetical protein
MFCGTDVSVAELFTSTSAEPPTTFTVSVSDAIFIVKSTTAVLPRPTTTSRVCAANVLPRSSFKT